VLSERVAVVSVTVADAPAPFGARRLQVGRIGSSASDFCDDCLFIGSADVEVGAMSGRVTTAAGRALPFAHVVLIGPDGRRRTVSAGPDGRWLATGLAPGAHRVAFLGTAWWAGEHWRDTGRAASARRIVVTAGKLRSGVDAELARRPAVRLTSVSPAVLDGSSPARVVLRGSGLAPIEGGFTVVIRNEVGIDWFAGPATDRTRSSLVVEAWLAPGTYDVIVRWVERDGRVRERRCDDCLAVSAPSFPI
jgi:hypothetical protein